MHIILYYSILYHRNCNENCHLNVVRPSTDFNNNTDMFHLASADKFSTILSYSLLYTRQQRYKIPKVLSSYRYQYELLTRKKNSDLYHSEPNDNDNNVSNAVSITSKIPELFLKCRGVLKITRSLVKIPSSLLTINIIEIIEYSDIAIIGFLWIASSAFFSTWTNFSFLQAFNDPLLHTFVRFFGSAVLGLIALIATGQLESFAEVKEILAAVQTPALFLWVANYANSCSLQASGITLTYVVKACIPVFTVLVCAAKGQRFSSSVLLSLLPICIGVGLASGSDVSFCYYGLAAALCSAIAQTLLNISIKEVTAKSKLKGPQAFLGMSIICSIITLPMLLFSSSPVSWSSIGPSLEASIWPGLLIPLTALSYYLEYIFNFSFVRFVSPLAFSVSDIGRRVAIIISGAMLFSKPLTGMNCLGVAVALGGVLGYSLVEWQEGQRRASK